MKPQKIYLILNLEKIFPLLIDDFIEEIFLDSPHEAIYINHQRFGRCRTDIQFSSKEIKRLKTLLRIYSGKRLDYVNPSIKLVINNKYFYLKYAVSTISNQFFLFYILLLLFNFIFQHEKHI